MSGWDEVNWGPGGVHVWHSWRNDDPRVFKNGHEKPFLWIEKREDGAALVNVTGSAWQAFTAFLFGKPWRVQVALKPEDHFDLCQQILTASWAWAEQKSRDEMFGVPQEEYDMQSDPAKCMDDLMAQRKRRRW